MDTVITNKEMYYIIDPEDNVVTSGFLVTWDSTEKGFGQLALLIDDLGKIEIDTESMGKEFFLDLMSKLYDMAEVK